VTVLRSGSATDVGRVRGSNQDQLLEEPRLFAVADGMGGHAGGEVAARLAVDALRSTFTLEPTLEGLRRAVDQANVAVWRQSQIQSDLRGMGTTLTAAALVADSGGSAGPHTRDVVAIANVGDSRTYLYSSGRLTQVTADHSLAEEKVRLGELTEAEAAVHPHRHILTRALGISPEVDVDLWELRLDPGDRILLCSDGLTNEVGTDEIARVLGSESDPDVAAQALVHSANEHGGNDNITVVVVDVLPDDRDQPPQSAQRDGGVAAPVAPASAAAASTVSPSDPPPAPPAPVRPPPPVPPEVPAAPPGSGPRHRPTRRERQAARRQAGIPRRLTLRVGLFMLMVVVIVAAAYGLVRWYATDSWYVTIDGNRLVVYQGRPGGLLWFQPKLVDRTPVTTAAVLPERIPALRADVVEPSLAAARRYVANLYAEYLTQRQLAMGESTGTTTTTAPTTTSVPAVPTSG